MCGIGGIYSYSPDSPPDLPTVKAMTDAMVHRGPDDEGFHLDAHIGLGMRRLSIIDLPSGQQPIYNEDKSVCVVFNGEIYNYRELRLRLLQRGHELRTNSDTEVIVHLYEDYGEEFVHHLNGMFVIALWDQRRRQLLLVRDRLGVKPLYYYHEPGRRLVFASEIKAILRVPGLRLDLDLPALHQYLTFRYVPGPRTLFSTIKKLLPGHRLRVDQRGPVETQYWDISHRKQPGRSAASYLEEFDHLFTDSVQKRLISDVPVGIFLSGGLDSSSVAAVAAGLVDRPLKSFSVAVDAQGELDEHGFALEVARRYNTDHHAITISPRQFQEFLPSFVWFMDEPVADQAAIPLYYLAKAAREHVTVVLSGEGSDEIFAGYSTDMRAYNRLKYYQLLPRALRARVLEPLAYLAFDHTRVRDFVRRAEAPLADINLHGPLHGMGIASALPHVLEHSLIAPSLRPLVDFRGPEELLIAYYKKTDATHFLDQRLYVTTKVLLVDDLLTKADKMTMANSLELRVPFLDYRIVEFAASLPPNLRLKRIGRNIYLTKPLLRRLMKDRLPRSILTRRKWGFMNPAAAWVRNELREITQDTLRSQRFRERGWFDYAFVDTLLDAPNGPTTLNNGVLWRLLVLELWCREFFDAAGAAGGCGPTAP